MSRDTWREHTVRELVKDLMENDERTGSSGPPDEQVLDTYKKHYDTAGGVANHPDSHWFAIKATSQDHNMDQTSVRNIIRDWRSRD